MKRIKNYIFSLIGLSLFMVGCTSDRGGIDPKVGIYEIPAITTSVDASGSQSIDVINLGSFKGKILVDYYFDEGPTLEKLDLVVKKTDPNGGKSIKLVQGGITSLPFTYDVDAATLSGLFGADPVLGDIYDFSVDIYQGDRKFEAFPAVGLGTATGPAGMPGYSDFARFGAICAYNADIYQGEFEVLSDAWEEVEPGTIVTLTKISESSFSFNVPGAVNPKPMVVNVNTNTNALSVATQSVGSDWQWVLGVYTGAFISGGGSVSAAAPCDEMFTIGFAYSVDIGGWGGSYPMVFKKVH